MYHQLHPLAIAIRKLRKIDDILAKHDVTPDRIGQSASKMWSTPYYDFICQSQCTRGELRLVWGMRFVARPHHAQGVFVELYHLDMNSPRPHLAEIDVYSHDSKGGWCAGSLVRHRDSKRLLDTIPDTKGKPIPEEHALAFIERLVKYFVRHGHTHSSHHRHSRRRP